jgi:hypothetical protein
MSESTEPGAHVAWWGNNATRPSRLHRRGQDPSRTRCGLKIPDGKIQTEQAALTVEMWEGLTCERSCFPELRPEPVIPTPAPGQCWRKRDSRRRGDEGGYIIWVEAYNADTETVTIRRGVDPKTGKRLLVDVPAGEFNGHRYIYSFG